MLASPPHSSMVLELINIVCEIIISYRPVIKYVEQRDTENNLASNMLDEPLWWVGQYCIINLFKKLKINHLLKKKKIIKTISYIFFK